MPIFLSLCFIYQAYHAFSSLLPSEITHSLSLTVITHTHRHITISRKRHAKHHWIRIIRRMVTISYIVTIIGDRAAWILTPLLTFTITFNIQMICWVYFLLYIFHKIGERRVRREMSAERLFVVECRHTEEEGFHTFITLIITRYIYQREGFSL